MGAAVLGLLLAAPPAAGQWSSDPSAPLAIVQSSTSESLEALVPTPNGKTWVVWTQLPDEVRVQRLDEQGQPLLGPSGKLAIFEVDHPIFSVDEAQQLESGNLLLLTRAENDCQSDATPPTIDATLVSPSGQVLWGPKVMITENCTIEPFGSPSYFTLSVEVITVVPMGGDEFLIGFVRVVSTYNGSTRTAFVERRDGAGDQLWSLTIPDGDSHGFADVSLGMVSSGDDVLVAYDDGFHSWAYRLDPEQQGAVQWTEDLNSAPGGGAGLGMVGPDDAGGALLTRPSQQPPFNAVELQRLNGDGSLSYPGPVLPIDIPGATPSLESFDAHPDGLGVTVAAAIDDPAAAGPQLRVQRLGPSGQRLWGDAGVLVSELPPPQQIKQIMVMASGTSALVFWREGGVAAGGALRAARLDENGVIDVAPFTAVAPPAAGTGPVLQARSTAGEALLAFAKQDLFGQRDLFGQNVTCAGELGPLVPGAAFQDLGLAMAGASGAPSLTGTGSLCPCTSATLSLTNGAPLTPAVLVMGLSAWFAPFKGGALIPSPDLQVYGLSTDAQGEFLLAATMPAQAVPGVEFWVQYWLLDATGPKGFTASNGMSFVMP
jgi:hypothetical protein